MTFNRVTRFLPSPSTKLLLQRGKRAGWTRLMPCIWLTAPGPATFMDWVHAAKLYYGEHIGIGGAAGLCLSGVNLREPQHIDIWLPPHRSVGRVTESRLLPRRDKLDRLSRINPRTNATSPGDALADVLNFTRVRAEAAAFVIATRRTFINTTGQIVNTVQTRSRQRHRSLAYELLTCQPAYDSVLEYQWVTQVETPHGIPNAQRQWRGPKEYVWDGIWSAFKTTLELDGKAYHSGINAITRDSAKDRAALAHGYTPIHFGYADVIHHPCATAAQLARLIPGMPHHQCEPSCPVPST
ncbi:hypothetical protein [Stomatohabitans albus]|uniref:hypothetical protein n=1 Tax=Stomatohabitans albus TaxID=3110766 RepID=UPI00300C5EA1